MDFRDLTNYFDGTIFADDYRTDLEAARKRIEAVEADNAVDLNQTDGLLLVQAVYSSICGDFVRATDYLHQLSDIAQSKNDSSLVARCAAYRIYVHCTQNNPPFLRFRIDIDTGPAITRGIGVSALRTRLLKATPQLSPIERLEANILRTCTDIHSDLWYQAFPEHPKYPKDLSIVLFRADQDYWEDIKCRGGDTDFPMIASYLNQLTLQYRLAGDASNARSSLLSIYENALEEDNFIAAAHCQLQLGDAILSPPFTSPVALNLVSVVREVGWSNDIWDKRQQDFPLAPDTEATQCYQKARFLFEAVGSKRGTASVLLRYACLDLAGATAKDTSKDSQAERDLLQSAYTHLTNAKVLFKGDITNSLIIDGYLAICKIMQGPLEEFFAALEMCFSIGEVGKHTGNTCTCEFVGMLYLRLARLLALDEARVQHAVVLCSCAAVLFKSLDNPYLELHATTASAKLHQQRGDIPMATKHVEKGRKLLVSSTTYFDNLKAKVESLRNSSGDLEQKWLEHDLKMLQSKHANCIAEFHRLTSSVGISRQNIRDRISPSPVVAPAQTQPSPMVALLESLQQFGGEDSPLLASLRSLTSMASRIDVLRQRYEDSIESRRNELVNHVDIDAAEEHLTNFLQELEDSEIFSEELEAMRAAAFQYLGHYDRARDSLTRVLPTSFGGTRESIVGSDITSKQLSSLVDKAERQKFDRVVSLCFVAKDWARGMAGIQAMLRQDSTALMDMKTSDDPHVWHNMVWVASILEHNGDVSGGFEWYTNAFHAVETYRQQLADTEDRRDTFSTIHSGELFFGMARIAFQFSRSSVNPCGPSEQWTLTPAEWRDQILRFHELGRSRTLLDLLVAQNLSREKFRKWSQYSYELRRKQASSLAKSPTEVEAQNYAEGNIEGRQTYLKDVYEELKKELESPSLAKLLSESDVVQESNARLFESISETAIVIHINIGREGLMILCITSQGIIDIHTAPLTSLQLARHVFRLTKLFHDIGQGAGPLVLPDIATCNQHLQDISDAIIGPVAEHIKAKQHVIFVPCPSLNKVPLCALVYNNEPLFLSKDVSQVPSLSVLRNLVDNKRRPEENVNVIYKEPIPSGREDLPFSTSTALHVARSFGATPRAASEALTPTEFIKTYEKSNVLLIATHGNTDGRSAWESSLLLHPKFLVRDLVKLESCASLVIFEACVSGVGEESIGNDLLGFSHAVLASGATAFLGGLWKISDEASAFLMRFLFQELKTSKGNKTLARCWRNAQKKLCELDTAGAVAIFEDMRRSCTRVFQAGWIDREVATRLRATLEIAINDIRVSGANYSHPFYWAPFVLMGHAGTVLELA